MQSGDATRIAFHLEWRRIEHPLKAIGRNLENALFLGAFGSFF
jgi:hypothetical protein